MLVRSVFFITLAKYFKKLWLQAYHMSSIPERAALLLTWLASVST